MPPARRFRPKTAAVWDHTAHLDAAGNPPMGRSGKPVFRCKHRLKRGIRRDLNYSGNTSFRYHLETAHHLQISTREPDDEAQTQAVIDLAAWTTRREMRPDQTKSSSSTLELNPLRAQLLHFNNPQGIIFQYRQVPFLSSFYNLLESTS